MNSCRCLFLVILFSFIAFHSVTAQQVAIQGNNELKWADGREYISGSYSGRRYIENRLNLDVYYGDLRFGSRFTLLQPSEFGETRTGTSTLEKRFLEYRDTRRDIRLRAGNFYTVWGRGLTLALVDDILQGFDSGLDGLLAGCRWRMLEAEVLTGRSAAGYTGDVREAQVHGAHLATRLPYGFTLAGQAVIADTIDGLSYRESRTYGGYLSYDGSFASAWIEHAREFITGVEDDHYATYASLSGFAGKLGIALDYKNYRYYQHSSRGGTGNLTVSTGILPFHSPPIVQREFTSNLFSKHPHIVRYDDEVGGQLELTWSPAMWGSFILSMAQSSSHPEEGALIPSLAEEDSPYREVFLEANTYPGGGAYLTGWTGWSEDLVYVNRGAVRSRVSWQKRAVLGGRLEIPLFGEVTALVSAEGMSVEDVSRAGDSKQHPEARFELGGIYLANYSLVGSLEMTGIDEQLNQEGRSTWFNLQGRAFIAERHELIVTAGQERGGLVCSSGKCRLVKPFDGVKISLVSIF